MDRPWGDDAEIARQRAAERVPVRRLRPRRAEQHDRPGTAQRTCDAPASGRAPPRDGRSPPGGCRDAGGATPVGWPPGRTAHRKPVPSSRAVSLRRAGSTPGRWCCSTRTCSASRSPSSDERAERAQDLGLGARPRREKKRRRVAGNWWPPRAPICWRAGRPTGAASTISGCGLLPPCRSPPQARAQCAGGVRPRAACPSQADLQRIGAALTEGHPPRPGRRPLAVRETDLHDEVHQATGITAREKAAASRTPWPSSKPAPTPTTPPPATSPTGSSTTAYT